MNSTPRILLVGPTALDYYGNPIKQRRLYLPGLTLPMMFGLLARTMQLICEA